MSSESVSASGAPPRIVSWIPGRDELPRGPLGMLDLVLVWIAVAGLAAMSVALILQVAARYLFSTPTVWSEELAVLLFVWVSMIAVALAVRRGEHLTLDLVSRAVRRPVLQKALAIGIAVLAVGTFLVLAYYCVKLLGAADRQALAGIQTGLGLPAKVSWIYAAVPVGFTLAAVFSVERLVLLLRGRVEVMSADADLQVIEELDAEIAAEGGPRSAGPADGGATRGGSR